MFHQLLHTTRARLLTVLVLNVLVVAGIATYVQIRANQHLTEQLATVPAAPGINPSDASLAWLWHISAIDPIYAFPTSDLETLDTVITKLVASKQQLQEMYASDPAAQATIHDRIYPEAFLYLLDDTERAREAFLTQPAEATAAAYYEQLDTLLAAYVAFTDDILLFLADHSADFENYAFWGGVSTHSSLTTAYEQTREQAIYQQARAHERYQCAQHWHSSCPDIRETLAAVINQVDLPLVPGVRQPIASSTITAIDRYHTLAYNTQGVGPTYQLTDNWCTPSALLPYFKHYDVPQAGRPYTVAEIVSDLYFHDTIASSRPFLDLLEENGIPLDQQTTSFYSCLDSPHLFSRVDTLRQLRFQLQEQSVAVKLPHVGPELIALEQALTQTDHVSETDLQAMVKQLLEYIVGRGQEIDTATYTDILAFATQYRSRSLDLPALLEQTTLANIDLNLISQAHNHEHVSPFQSLFVNRTYPVALLFIFNATVSPTPISFYDAAYGIQYAADNQLRSYTGDLEQQYTIDDLYQMKVQAAPFYELTY